MRGFCRVRRSAPGGGASGRGLAQTGTAFVDGNGCFVYPVPLVLVPELEQQLGEGVRPKVVGGPLKAGGESRAEVLHGLGEVLGVQHGNLPATGYERRWNSYLKNQCPFCDKAKYELRNEDFEVKNISENQEFLPELMDRNPNARTMPQIFKGDQLIGGYDALMALRQVTSGDLSL